MMKNKNAFTLLELLVVIGIISILMALGTVSYLTAQAKSRDSRRISDMKAIQNSLEQYYSNNSFRYPTVCSDASTNINGSWPEDPYNGTIDGKEFVYSESCLATSYCVCARLERGAGNYGDSETNPDPTLDCSTSSWVVGTGEYYCVANLQ